MIEAGLHVMKKSGVGSANENGNGEENMTPRPLSRDRKDELMDMKGPASWV